MKHVAYAVLAALAFAPFATAQKQTLIFTNRYDVISTGASTTTPTALSAIRGHDICAVTPGKGATAFSLIPSTALHAQAGDADADGKVAQLSGVTTYSNLAISGPFLKWADKGKGDPRLIYWTVKTGSTKPASFNVFSNGKSFTVKSGDFVRINPNGEVEFFITQALIMKAAGKQTGSWVDGATCICQDKDGNLWYAGPHGKTNSGSAVAGGHWLEKGLSSGKQFLYDAGVAMIRKADITYDANGNVKDVKPASAVVAYNEIGNPTNQPNVRDMTKNSGARDDKGCATDITFWMGGLDIDPAGGTFVNWSGIKQPNMIFTIVRSAFRSCGSWKGTIFSTAPNKNALGSIAVINGVMMGTNTGNADASWLGLQNGKTLSSAPLLYGLCVMNTKWNALPPYGPSVVDAGGKDGVFTVGTDKTFDLGFQGPTARFPVAAISWGLGVAKGGKQTAIDLSGVGFGGFGSFYPPAAGWSVFAGTATNVKGQVGYAFPLPNDPGLKGKNLIFQGVMLRLGGGLDLTNPATVEFN